MNRFIYHPKFTVLLKDGELVVVNPRGQEVVKARTFRQVEDWLDYRENEKRMPS